jgi:hypothetical protein
MIIAKKSNPTVKKPHYVPRFILKNFSSRRKKDNFQIHVFDKEKEIFYESNIKDVMCEKDFHKFNISYEGEEFEVDYDNQFSPVETAGSAAIRKLVEEKNLSKISEQEKVNIASFLTFQFFRGKSYRSFIKRMNEELYNHVKQFPKSGDDDPMEIFGAKGKVGDLRQDDDRIKKSVLKTLRNPKKLGEIVTHLMIKKWALYETNKSNPFYISDTPVVLSNEKQFGPYGNIGFALPGIEIYFPLSSTLTLGLICPLYYKESSDSLRQYNESKKLILSLKAIGKNLDFKALEQEMIKGNEAASRLRSVLEIFDTGLPMKCGDEIVMYLNSLQISYAERFIARCNNDFSLAKVMIKDSEKFKKGLMGRSLKF